MIPNNGFIQIKGSTGGGLVNGIPVAASDTIGGKIPCHIETNKQNNKGIYVDGNFTQYAFTVYFDMQSFEANRVQLTNKREELIGDFEVQSIEFLDLVQRVKVIV